MAVTRYTKELILNKFLEYASINSFEECSARNITEYIGCSVAPIYTAFGNFGTLIEEAREAIIQRIINNMKHEYVKDNDLISALLAVICFARDNEYLYREVFINNVKPGYITRIKDHIGQFIYSTGNTIKDEFNDEELDVLFTKVWISMQGMCSMILSNQLANITNEFLGDAIMEISVNLIQGMLFDKGTLQDYDYYHSNQFSLDWTQATIER